MNLLTSVNTRQVIIDSMGIIVKCANVLQSQEMKTLITSVPILLIRVIDTMSSGEAKLFYHSIGNLVSSMIDFVNQEDMTVLIAEVTARIVHALEMENYHHLPLSQRRKWKYHYHHNRNKNKRNDNNNNNHHNRKKVFIAGGKRMMMIMKRKAKNKRNGIHHDEQYYNHYYNNIMTEDQLHNATEAEKRMKRNQYMNQTYNQKVLLQDNYDNEDFNNLNEDSAAMSFSHDRQVEDAILSSLSHDNTTMYSDSAWLTKLGRRDGDHNTSGDHDLHLYRNNDDDTKDGGNKKGRTKDHDDAMSLPSKVILNAGESQDEHHVDAQFSVASSLNLDDLEVNTTSERNGRDMNDVEDNEYDLVDVVDTAYLRSSIRNKKEKGLKDQRYSNNQSSAVNDNTNDNEYRPKPKEVGELGIKNQQSDIEDLVFNRNSNSVSHEEMEINKTVPKTFEPKREKKITLNMSDDAHLNKAKSDSKKVRRGYTPSYMKSKSKYQKTVGSIHGKEASVAHFYRALDDIATMIRNQTLTDILKGETVNDKDTGKKWYPNAAAAAGLGNESGQETLNNLLNGKGLKKPTRYQANIGVGIEHNIQNDADENETISPWKAIFNMILGKLSMKHKAIIGIVVSVYICVSVAWFVFGCYGVYKWFSASAVAPIHDTQPINEYVIRIVQEVPHTNVMEVAKDSIVESARSGTFDFAATVAASIAEKDEV